MPDWTWIVLVVALGVVLWRATFRTVIANMTDDGRRAPTALDVRIALSLATLFFYLLGPIYIAVAIVDSVPDLGLLARVLGGETRAVRRRRREREMREREERVRQAERELEIR